MVIFTNAITQANLKEEVYVELDVGNFFSNDSKKFDAVIGKLAQLLTLP